MIEKKIIQKLIKTINRNKLINKNDRVLTALSGGADSVFLLYALKSISEDIGFEIGACHIEHGIRGENSVHDMDFSKKICNEMGIDFFCKQVDVPSVAQQEKLSLEAAGRKIRYEYFSQILKEYKYTCIATAHHMDDKTETILMNIIRGCGLRGFAGIEYKNGNIIRPLLDIKKSEIVEYLDNKKIPYCTDETNSDVSYTRNFIRHIILPSLKKVNPSVEESFLRQSIIFTDEDCCLSEISEKAYSDCVDKGRIEISKLLMNHRAICRRVVYMYLASQKGSNVDITEADVEACMGLCQSGVTGKRCNLSGGLKVCVDYGKFYVSEYSGTPEFEYSLEFNVPVVIEELGIRVTLLPFGGKLLIKESDVVTVRNKRDGDLFYPTGMIGSKKLKSFYSDKKIPRELRSSIPLLVVNSEIASVIGYRDDRRFVGNGGNCRVLTESI